jgi:hypothetical protein
MRVLLLVAVAVPLMGQSSFPKHNISAGLGVGLPRGQLSGLLHNSAGVSVGYGYRFQRNFQADIGLDTLFGAARVRDFLYSSDLGYLRIRDFQYMVPFGGRAVLPLREGRVLASLGGGGMYMRYSERLRQPSSYYHFECPDCSSRSGWGTYALAGASVAIDRYQNLRFGVTAKACKGYTNGGAIGSVPAERTRDFWVSLFAGLTIGF